MKKLLIALLLVCSSAHAEKWLELRNNAGGKIILMFTDCRGGKGKMVIATSKTGDNYNGCWYYFTDMVHIVWEDGRTSSFEPNDFTVKDDK